MKPAQCSRKAVISIWVRLSVSVGGGLHPPHRLLVSVNHVALPHDLIEDGVAVLRMRRLVLLQRLLLSPL